MSYYDQWMSDQKERSKLRTWQKVFLGAVAFLIFLGYLTERDIAAHAEMAKQMECVPEIEMTMPIEERVMA